MGWEVHATDDSVHAAPLVCRTALAEGIATMLSKPVLHLARTWPLAAAEHRVRQKGNTGLHAKSRDHLARHLGDVGQLLSAGIHIDKGVGDEQRVLIEEDRVQGNPSARAFTAPDHLLGMIEMAGESADQAIQHAIDIC